MGKHAYVANCANDRIVTVLDTATNKTAATVPNLEALDIEISPDGKHAYATTFEGRRGDRYHHEHSGDHDTG